MDLILNGGRSSGSCGVCSVRADNEVNTELTNANLQLKNADLSIATKAARLKLQIELRKERQ